MRYPVHQAAADHHKKLVAEAESARRRRVQGVVIVEISLPASQRRGLRTALLRLLIWPNRLEIHL